MKYLFVFFIIFCLSVGMITLIMSFFILQKNKSNFKIYFFLFLFFYFIIFSLASIYYFMELFTHIPPFPYKILTLSSLISGLMINMVLISFMHDFLQFAQTKLIKRLINILLVCFFAVFIVHNIYIYCAGADLMIANYLVSGIKIEPDQDFPV